MKSIQQNLRSVGKLTALTAFAGTVAFGSFAAHAAGSSTGSYENKYSAGSSSTGSYQNQQAAGSYTNQSAGTYNGGTVVDNTGTYNGSTVQTYSGGAPATTGIIGGNAGDTGNYVHTGDYVFPTQ